MIQLAGAGESGKEFAVVTSEVKVLAKLAARATEDIRLRIGGMRVVSSDACSAMDQVLQIISTIDSVAQTTASSIE